MAKTPRILGAFALVDAALAQRKKVAVPLIVLFVCLGIAPTYYAQIQARGFTPSVLVEIGVVVLIGSIFFYFAILAIAKLMLGLHADRNDRDGQDDG
jgi:hypothetical protein